MAQITINEISKNYTYSTGTSTFCSVAMPMTASWGPAFEDPDSLGISLDDELEQTTFQHFAATQEGLEAFTSTYRGPAANYRSAKDFSYQIATTLLTAGYDLDICRVCSGAHASGTLKAKDGGTFTFQAKYPGSFGNNLVGVVKKVPGRSYWNALTYIIDDSGSKTAVENLVFVFNLDDSTESIPHVSEISSSFFDFVIDGIESDDTEFEDTQVTLTEGSDRLEDSTPDAMMTSAIELAQTRYGLNTATDSTDYVAALNAIKGSNPSVARAATIRYMEWNYNAAYYVLDILSDKLAYNSKRLIMPGWDDQNYWLLSGETVKRLISLSPLHCKMMDVAAQARCCTALLDIPKSLERSGVWIDSSDSATEGYAQKISRYVSTDVADAGDLFPTHSALFGPWCTYKFVGTSRNNIAPPAFLALLIQIAMVKNQSLQYEWIQPETRKHSLTIGSPDYVVPKKVLDEWQGSEGVSLNVLTTIPDLGMTVWGNSTCYEVPVAQYNALQNLSTRYLMNAVEDVIYRCGIAITFQYNNNEAYSRFYAGVTPTLDTMKAAGAITSYEVHMSKDLNGLDSVNLNSVVGTVTLYVEGIINNITIDLVALPAGTES